ncbi:MAG TPA: leucine--tRNA ligase, partial [Gammaproteobacteria bacterium]|nr:leucine--tRNA ligase [Gammaproteobacteria bacterium]
ESMVLLLSPIVPHITHALWRALGHERAVVDEPWPTVDRDALRSDTVTLVVQVNGKLRGRIQVPADADRAAVEQAARQEENVRRFVEGREVKKVIVVPGRLVNIVAA